MPQEQANRKGQRTGKLLGEQYSLVATRDMGKNRRQVHDYCNWTCQVSPPPTHPGWIPLCPDPNTQLGWMLFSKQQQLRRKGKAVRGTDRRPKQISDETSPYDGHSCPSVNSRQVTHCRE